MQILEDMRGMLGENHPTLTYLFISEHLLNDISECKINPGLHSDHSILSLELNANNINRGKGLWKCNLKLLKDMNYVKLVKNTVEQCKNDFCQQENKNLVWELIKLRIRSATIPYCIKRKTERTTFKLNLENELLRLQQELDYNNSETTLHNYNSSKRELEQIEISETHSHIFRSKIKWTEVGENNSKFFLSLEKTNYSNMLISQLNVNGKVIKDQKNIANAQKNFYQNLYSEKLNSNDISYKDSLDNFINTNPMKR